MIMLKNKNTGETSEKISRRELRETLILETIKENHVALERLSRT